MRRRTGFAILWASIGQIGQYMRRWTAMTANEWLAAAACGTKDPAPPCGSQDPAPACGSADPNPEAPACGTQDK